MNPEIAVEALGELVGKLVDFVELAQVREALKDRLKMLAASKMFKAQGLPVKDLAEIMPHMAHLFNTLLDPKVSEEYERDAKILLKRVQEIEKRAWGVPPSDEGLERLLWAVSAEASSKAGS